MVEDAPGTISIIDVSGEPAPRRCATRSASRPLDGDEAALETHGLRTYDGGTLETDEGDIVVPDSAVSQDIEPEYIAVSPDGTRAYVTLQEVNAVAVIDLTDPTADRPLSILPLGAVDFSLRATKPISPTATAPAATASISVGNAPVNGAAAARRDRLVRGRRRDLLHHRQRRRRRIAAGCRSRCDESGYRMNSKPAIRTRRLQADAIGRLNVMNHDGETDGDGDLDQIYTYRRPRHLDLPAERRRHHRQGRGDRRRVRAILARCPTPTPPSTARMAAASTAAPTTRGRSRRASTSAPIGGRTYAFVALERVGGVMIYDVSDPANASFVGYRPPTATDFGPEVVKFITAGRQPDRPRPAGHRQRDQRQHTTDDTRAAVDDQIYTIQGTGHVSALDGQTVTTRAWSSRSTPTAAAASTSRIRTATAMPRRPTASSSSQRGPDRDGRTARQRHRHGRRVRRRTAPRPAAFSTTEIVATAASASSTCSAPVRPIAATVIGGAADCCRRPRSLAEGAAFYEASKACW